VLSCSRENEFVHILRICQDVPYPPNDGVRIEPFYTTKYLAERGHEITILAFDKGGADASPMRQWCELHTLAFHGRNSFANAVRSTIEGTPINYVKYRDHRMLERCMELLREKPYDVVVVDYSMMGWYVFQIRKNIKIPVVTRWHNVDTLIWKRWAETQANPVKRMLGWLQYKYVRHFEQRLASASDICLTVGARDTELLRELAPKAHVKFLPPGVDAEHYAFAADTQEPASMLLLASDYGWHPNRDAAEWLYEKIMPRVWAAIPAAKLYMSGKNAPAKWQTWSATRPVVLTGFVPDERSLIARTSVVVVPMRLGGGIKLKILTAFAAGRAVVTTSTGAEGVPGLTNGEQLLIRDSPEQFADAVVEVIQNQELRRRLEVRGRALVCQQYDWRALASIWEEVLTQMTKRGASWDAPRPEVRS
jgi:glycosyltransferase involved in cell wall biosynthesis